MERELARQQWQKCAEPRRRRRSGACARLLALAGVLAGVVPVASNSPATGRIVGRVRLVAVNSSRPLAIAYSSRALLPQGQAPREIRNVVIYLQGMPSTPVPPKRYQLRQEGEVFLPHVLPVARGASVDFTNGDRFYHNVFSLSRAGTFDLGRFPRGQSRDRRVHGARACEGLLPPALGHERRDHGARSPVVHDAAG